MLLYKLVASQTPGWDAKHQGGTLACMTRLACRPPRLLTVHLKRFQMDMRGRAKKLSDSVAFGLQLDVGPWCDQQVTPNIPTASAMESFH